MGWAKRRPKGFDIDLVRAAIDAAERRTSAEIVVAVVPFFLGRVWSAAQRAFTKLGISRTRARNGVLVFLVPARHRVVVLADEGAYAEIDPEVWRATADRIAAGFGRGDATAGLVEGIGRLASALSAAFPRQPGDLDELPNLPVVAGPA